MTPEEVATVLAMVSAAEGRPVDEAQVALWSITLAVHGITQEEFRWAVIQHYASSTYPIRPGHVWQIIEPRRERERVEKSLTAEIERSTRYVLLEQGERTGDWAEFDTRYPGFRQEQVARELTWWMLTDQPTPPELLARAAELGVTPTTKGLTE